MLKSQSNTDLDDGPHTLRSDLPSMEFSTSSMYFMSSPLQISQSPTRVTQDKETLCPSIHQETHTTSERKMTQEMPVSEGIYSNVQTIKQSTTREDLNIPSGSHICSPLPELSSCTSPDHNVNSLSTPVTIPDYNPLPVPSTSGTTPTPVYLAIPEIPSHLKFFSFVILHVPEDQKVASRVCHVLQELVYGEGTTFCEGFETPGVSPITCLEDAVENSAYIILLLTNGFFSKWGKFQTNVVLMNSIQDGNKSGSVIPFYPTLNSAVDKPKLPLCLRSLTALCETSTAFNIKVHKTFKEDVIKREFEQWKRQQLDKLYKKRVEDLSDQLHSLQKFSQEYETICKQLRDQMFLMQSNNFPLLWFQGQPQVIQISHANNVQIGNQNHMTVQQLGNGPSTEMNGESCHEGDSEAQS